MKFLSLLSHFMYASTDSPAQAFAYVSSGFTRPVTDI